MALRLPSVLHCPKLCFASLGALVHGYLCGLNTLDCRVFLPHGVDGETMLHCHVGMSQYII